MKNYSKIPQFMLFIFLWVACISVKEIAANGLSASKFSIAPDFKLQDLRENTVTLSSYRDKKPVILFFWTTWCPFCRTELKVLNDKYQDLTKDGFEVLAINVGEYAYKVDNFVKRYSPTFGVLLDKDTAVAGAYELLGVPTYVVVDKQGYIRFKGHTFPKHKYQD